MCTALGINPTAVNKYINETNDINDEKKLLAHSLLYVATC